MPTYGSGFTARGVRVKRRITIAWRTSNNPTDATTLARAGASRSRRKISQWMARPRTTQNRSDTTSAGQNDIGPPREIRLGQSGRSSCLARLEPVGDTLDERQRVRQRWHEEVALGAQPGIHIGDEHGDRAVGEVDHTRTEVGEHDAQGDRRDQGALGDAVAGDEAVTKVVRGEDRNQHEPGEDHHHRHHHPGGGRRRAPGGQPSGVTSIGSPFNPLRMFTHSPSMYC